MKASFPFLLILSSSIIWAEDWPRFRGPYVFAASTEFKQLANNRFAKNDSDFNASPAVSDGQIFLRSNQFLYCIEE